MINLINHYILFNKPFRCEKKFLVTQLSKDNIKHIITLNSANFHKIFSKRIVNNIYIDTFDLKNFEDSLNGNAIRIKIRIRWYGETFGNIQSPNLELKIKNNNDNTKVSYALDNFKLTHNTSSSQIITFLLNQNIPEIVKLHLQDMQCVLINRYERTYMLSSDKLHRLTFDENIKTYPINNSIGKERWDYIEDSEYILELKYLPEHHYGAQQITNEFPFRLSKSSKYLKSLNLIFN